MKKRVKKGTKKLDKGLLKWRYWVLGSLLCLLPTALAWHLAHLQVIPGEEYDFRFLQSEGEARTLRNRTLNAYRGVITDRNDELLAVSTEVKSIVLNPQQLDPQEVPAIARALGLGEKKFSERLQKYRNKQFMYLARQIAPQDAEKITALNFSGVSVEHGYQRFYPAGEVAAHVVGFTDIDDRGQEGIELAFDRWLAGKSGAKRVVNDLKGNVIKELGMLAAPQAGNDLRLTIDLRLQYLAYRELKAAVKKQNAKAGTAVVLDVATGDILAMVNQPSYNPNNRGKLKPWQMRNRALTDVFEPGSTVKPFTIVAALETGRYRPESVIDTSPGFFRVGKKTVLDFRDYGVLDLTTIITKSSQVGISKLALDMRPKDVRNLFFRFGLGRSSGIGFPGESVGVLPSRRKWSEIETATLAYGYGLSVNALQLAQAYAVIAAGGEMRPAQLVDNGTARDQPSRVTSLKISRQVTEMLKTVTRSGGTGTRAQIHEYPVAGKSGTAHKVNVGGYAEDKYRAFFAGFAPAGKPRIVAVVAINEPKEGGYYGGEAAAPVFAEIVKKSLQVLHEPPVNKDQFISQVKQ